MGKAQRFLLLAVLFLGALAICGAFFHQVYSRDFSARQNEHRRKFGAVYMTLNNPFYEIIDEEIRTAVENQGDVLLSRDPALSVERQTQEIQDLIDSGIDVLFLNAVDWKEMGPALELAYKAHVPVVVIDTDVQDDKYVACTVLSDNYLAGVECAQHLVSHAKGGNIALLKHSEAKSAVDRIQGFLDTIAQHPEFRVVDEAECKGQLELAMPAMEQMLEKQPEINIVMALNDPAALGAIAALQHAGRLDDVMVYGVDGVPETKEMIVNGRMTATAGQSPRQIGRLAVQNAYRILYGEQPQKVIRLKTNLITQQNVREYNIGGWD